VTRVEFHFNVAGKVSYACQLARNVLSDGQRMVICCSDAALLAELNQKLWTASAVEFLPHCFCADARAADTPILLSCGSEDTAHHETLINLDRDRPDFFTRFERVLEIVSLEAEDRDAGRSRWRFYRERGYAVTSLDAAGANP